MGIRSADGLNTILGGMHLNPLTVEDEVREIATTHPRWAPVSASVSEAAALMVSLGIRHLVVLDITGRPTGIVSMSEIFSVLVQAQDPTSLYAVFTDIMLRRTTN